MDNSLSDPSDWLNTSLPPFSALENSLRCQVCKDFFTTPMVTTCSHTFCSICIRRCLSVDGKCPACRANDQASKLRRNWALEEVVGAFKTARPVALEIATKDKKGKEEAPSRPNKRRRTQRNSGGSDLTVRTTRSQAKRTQDADGQPPAFDGADDNGSDAEYTENGGTQPERAQTPDDGLVACPICQTRMKEEVVFNHIGTSACTSPSQKQREQPQPTTKSTPQPPTNTKPLPDRLTEFNYSLLNDKALRKKLTELGIPSGGSKALLSRRHTEWVNLWNANVDAGAPRTKRELLNELNKWDRSIGREPDQFGTSNQVMKKDFDAQAWSSGNKDDFSRLIEQARQGRNKQAAQQQKESALAKDSETKDEQDPEAMQIDTASSSQPLEPEKDLPKGYHDATNPQENFPDVEHPPPSGQRVPPPKPLKKETSLPEKFGTDAQKVNMFEVSSHPIADVDPAAEAEGH
ncbi:DNA repair protein rad18 [Aureobasidium subglaciale]|nr:DNA repair protein rad18 [Aureobasidium subglaciale]